MQINPYLMFNGNCEAAFRYYETHLGGKITAMMKYSDAPPMPEGHQPPEGCAPDMTGAENLVMHACMEVGGISLMASDAPPSMPQEKMQGISVTLNLTSEPDARRIFAALSQGGTVTSPLQQTFWAKAFGTVTDRFGTPWMINCMDEMQMRQAS